MKELSLFGIREMGERSVAEKDEREAVPLALISASLL
jgi:hypothetical protein